MQSIHQSIPFAGISPSEEIAFRLNLSSKHSRISLPLPQTIQLYSERTN
jgi:hypothetical protein